MRVAIATSSVPFIGGGAVNFIDWLGEALRDRGHDVDVVSLPFDDDPQRIVSQMATFRMVDLTDQADIAVCVRPPAYLIRHPRKVLWFIHHVRVFYDMWDTIWAPPKTPKTIALRDTLHRVDTAAFREAAHIFTNSATVSDRLMKFNGVDSEVLYPPLPPSYALEPHPLGNEIVAISRLEPHKRQDLLIAAMAHTKTPVTLRLIGSGSTGSYLLYLRSQVALHRLQRKVVVDGRWMPEEEKRSYVAHALAGAYVPEDEDSYGYPMLEYATANRPLLSVTDSGGVTEFLRDGIEGRMVEPSPAALAEAMDALYEDRTASERMGHAARARINELGISWDRVVERLTSV